MPTPILITGAPAGQQRLTRARRWLWAGVSAIIGFPGAVLLVACLVYPPTYVFRLVRWGEADLTDYQRFPARGVQASGTP